MSLSTSPSRQLQLCSLRNTVGNLKTEFVSFKDELKSSITLLDEFQNLKENIEHTESKYKNEIHILKDRLSFLESENLELRSDLKKCLNSDKQQYKQLGKIESSLIKINQSLSELSQTKEEIHSSISKEGVSSAYD